MDRIDLWKPRATSQYVMPVSSAIELTVHWHQRSWVCGNTDGEGTCRLCDLVPGRNVVYFAALCKTALAAKQEAVLVLVERSASWKAEAERQSGCTWEELLGYVVVCEEIAGRERSITQTIAVDNPRTECVQLPQLAFSIARLYRCPHFPEVHSLKKARRCLAAFSTRQQSLLLHQPTEVL